ncbi:HNH endonuclease [Elizabethkingia anophelis]|uniref:HNH endonuclease signature motif containing protein n=1 Tax=Elizabethkingia anophelis TaxID=1117645 RepID=UPI001626E5FE|nr:HNH endonuclease signature motif containing protein [Elizabethkingia anophelis]MCT3693486.1 HNH endonuclease [Elizabethkingia anophelis]MCT3824956.1 HNH endonuclease [Elizabethkingia anophelis]MCT3932261.1 HNH endonuclease [Elizabethkingia anophelis]MCT4078327.1 HNH endonuclease [Elizabethkingia anophelis]MCT4081658.1 HNH endonuclease [Elizabethkingia anophelis]
MEKRIYIKDDLGNSIETKYFIDRNGYVNRKGRNLKLTTNYDGYKVICMSVNGIRYVKYIHRLVAESFIPNDKNKSQINHINGVKSDNRVENLAWCTQSENIAHAYKNGLNISRKGSKSGRSKLNEKIVSEIRLKAANRYRGQVSELANEYGVTVSIISMIISNKVWKHI